MSPKRPRSDAHDGVARCRSRPSASGQAAAVAGDGDGHDGTSPGELPDEELIDAARRSGEEGCSAFDELVTRYRDRVVRLTSHLLGAQAPAEDVAQEAFVRAFLAIGGYPKGVPFWPWIRVIVTRLAFNHRRDARTRDLYESRAPAPASQPSPARALVARDELERVLERLPYPYREILVLRHVEELSIAEIAEELELGLSAAKMRLSRAHQEFRAVHGEITSLSARDSDRSRDVDSSPKPT